MKFFLLLPLLCNAAVNVAELRQSTTYLYGVDIPPTEQNSENEVIQWIWKALESFTQEQLGQFLEFVSGSNAPPIDGFIDDEGNPRWLYITLEPAVFGRTTPVKLGETAVSFGGAHLRALAPFNRNCTPLRNSFYRNLIVGYFDSYELLRQQLLVAID